MNIETSKLKKVILRLLQKWQARLETQMDPEYFDGDLSKQIARIHSIIRSVAGL